MAPGLTDEQRYLFELRLKQLGMDTSQVVAELVTGATLGPTVLSDVPGRESAIPAYVLTIDSVDEIKRLFGNADEDFEQGIMAAHHAVPQAWPQEKNDLLPQDLDPSENHDIRKALIAYVYDHSARVKSYKNIIEKHYFPMAVGAFAVEDVTISADHPLILTGNNHTYNFGVVTIEPGGQIICQGVNVDMWAQKMVALPAQAAYFMESVTAAGGNTYALNGADGNNADQVPGDQGDYPGQGDPGPAGIDNNDDCNCGTPSGQGKPGTTGYTGAPGVNGGNGGNGSQFKQTTGDMTGDYSINSSGGHGGNGGKGGRGGLGQAGGPGGAASTYCTAGAQGPGGPGGKGGPGGTAGKGGDAANVYITYTTGNPAPTFNITARAGVKGSYGVGGDGGPAGSAGVPPGGKGVIGDNGLDSTNGQPAEVYINGKPATPTA